MQVLLSAEIYKWWHVAIELMWLASFSGLEVNRVVGSRAGS